MEFPSTSEKDERNIQSSKYTLFNVTHNNKSDNKVKYTRKKKTEIIDIPKYVQQIVSNDKRESGREGFIKKQQLKRHYIVKSLTQQQQQPLNIITNYFIPSTSNGIIHNRNYDLSKKIIEIKEKNVDKLNEWMRKMEKDNIKLTKSILTIFRNVDDRYELYVLHILCNTPPTFNIFDIENATIDQLQTVNKNFVITIIPDKSVYVKKRKQKETPKQITKPVASDENDYVKIVMKCPIRKKCMPYFIQNGTLTQSKRFINVNDKFIVCGIYALLQFIRNCKSYSYPSLDENIDSRVIIINCYVKSTFNELLNEHYYNKCIRNKYGGIINFISN